METVDIITVDPVNNFISHISARLYTLLPVKQMSCPSHRAIKDDDHSFGVVGAAWASGLAGEPGTARESESPGDAADPVRSTIASASQSVADAPSGAKGLEEDSMLSAGEAACGEAACGEAARESSVLAGLCKFTAGSIDVFVFVAITNLLRRYLAEAILEHGREVHVGRKVCPDVRLWSDRQLSLVNRMAWVY
ncbi:hypothetical protein AN477_22125 [Alicyclobacillus ferrooxydans]|uniref:Uncharacterized protein n=2 Tax=Alicyclobacillus ferrooxydans TaxID=471514 RepID=A0A0P9CTC5_9BACL|nr:hypothetical protein AN477_22125 [Alicyclobacillus ferrooxydans]